MVEKLEFKIGDTMVLVNEDNMRMFGEVLDTTETAVLVLLDTGTTVIYGKGELDKMVEVMW